MLWPAQTLCGTSLAHPIIPGGTAEMSPLNCADHLAYNLGEPELPLQFSHLEIGNDLEWDHLDWTFEFSSRRYESRTLYVLVGSGEGFKITDAARAADGVVPSIAPALVSVTIIQEREADSPTFVKLDIIQDARHSAGSPSLVVTLSGSRRPIPFRSCSVDRLAVQLRHGSGWRLDRATTALPSVANQLESW